MKHHTKSGFTVIEVVAAMTLLAVAMLLIAQLGYCSLRERARSSTLRLALELAANVLESARATPWEGLTAEWATSQRIPDELKDFLPEGRLTVQVTTEESLPQTKRVTAEVQWLLPEGIESRPVRLVTLFTARTSAGEGGQQ